MSFLLEATGVSKHYGGVRALSDVSLALQGGEVHALVGENGAGKSTLIKILSGVVAPDGGSVKRDGQALALGSIAAAEAAGISVIHQETTAFPDLSAEDNIFVGRELRRAGGLLLDRARMRAETRELLDRLGLKDVRPDTPVGDLSLASRQLVAMARALSRRSRVLILDEPTASLSAREADALFTVVRALKADGVGLLYVSHRLDEVFALSEQITILRDGRLVETRPTSEYTRDQLIRRMVGRDRADLTDAEERGDPLPDDAPPLLEVKGLTRTGVFADVSFSLRAGEIVGLGGLVGAGRSEVAQAIFGADRFDKGAITLDNKPVPGGSIAASVARGIALVPEDRKETGLVLALSVQDNLTMAILRSLSSGGILRSSSRETETAQKLIADLSVRTATARLPVGALSGGNQQKVALGKWLATRPRVLILDEPTRGVDVGAKAEIYRLIRHLAQEGMATLLISSDLPELLAMSDRILVMRAGRVAGELTRESATEETVLSLAFGEGKRAA